MIDYFALFWPINNVRIMLTSCSSSNKIKDGNYLY